MKLNSQAFLDHINKASMGGLVNEMVLGKDLSFAVTDDTKSVLAICGKGLGKGQDIEVGIFDLGMFTKAVQYAKDVIFAGAPEIEMDLVENRLVFSKDERDYKFLLSNPKVISTVVENSEEVIEKVSASDPTTIKLNSASLAECIKAINSVSSEKCEFRVENGKVKLTVGDDIKHIIGVPLGTGEGKGKFKLVVKPDYLTKILSVLPSDVEATLELRPTMPLIFRIPGYIFLLASMEIE